MTVATFGTAKRVPKIRNKPPAATSETTEGLSPEVSKDKAFGGSGVVHQRRWAASDNIFWTANQTYDALPAGLYRCDVVQGIGPVLRKSNCETDKLLQLADSATADVMDEIKTFWSLKKDFAERGLIHKRGVLMYGPPGGGKTATIQLLIKDIVENYGGISVYIDSPKLASTCLAMVRNIEPERPIVAMMEDFDALVDEHGENEFLALLDGEAQIANVVYVATTNYPEALDKRFVDRPSRFDLIMQIGMPSATARRQYLLHKEPSLQADDEIEKWVKSSDGYSIAHLRELIILCKCYKYPLDKAVKRLNLMREQTLSSSRMDYGVKAKAVGFM